MAWEEGTMAWRGGSQWHGRRVTMAWEEGTMAWEEGHNGMGGGYNGMGMRRFMVWSPYKEPANHR